MREPSPPSVVPLSPASQLEYELYFQLKLDSFMFTLELPGNFHVFATEVIGLDLLSVSFCVSSPVSTTYLLSEIHK